MWDEDLGDPLGSYLASLQKLLGLNPGITYPAHGTLIDRGDERADRSFSITIAGFSTWPSWSDPPTPPLGR